MGNNSGIKGYFIFVTIVGYMIFLVSSFNYLQHTDQAGFKWFISMLIAVFIVLFKNTKIVISKYKVVYSLLDSFSLLIIMFVLKYVLFLEPISKLVVLSVYIFLYLYVFYMLVVKNKIIFLE